MFDINFFLIHCRTQPFEFGASQLRVSPGLLRKLIKYKQITASPCGAIFVKSAVREGVLPRLLREILEARLMIKQSMKLYKNDKLLQRILHSRQLGLKLMANVIYGYTAANWSGRMPCVEVGDSVVSKGRETLERAIKLVESNKLWNAKIVYGDTDSMFVLVEGRSREEAFRIGAEIAAAVTNDNPKPVKLKLEKVYQPCILQVIYIIICIIIFYIIKKIINFLHYRLKNDMLVICTKVLTNKNQFMMQKVLKRYVVMVVQLLLK